MTTLRTMFQLKDHWRVMKVKHGDSHPGGINKIEVITRHGLTASDIRYNDYRGGSNVEIFGFIKGYGRVLTMKELENAVAGKSAVRIDFQSYDRNNGKLSKLESVKYAKSKDHDQRRDG